MSELHDDIMRIPVPKSIEYDLLANKVEAYKIGHRDARHAAAELAAAEGIEQLKAELECARGDLSKSYGLIYAVSESVDIDEFDSELNAEVIEFLSRIKERT